MAGQAQTVDKATAWGGNASPFGVTYGKMMMWFFLISDALTFGGFLVSLGFFRYKYEMFEGIWPVGEEVFHSLPFLHGHYPLMYVALMTFILIVSSVTMVLAVEAGHRNDKSGVIKWMIATVIGGAIFVGSQGWEWSHFIHGSTFGKVQIEGGYSAIVKADEHGHAHHEDLVAWKEAAHDMSLTAEERNHAATELKEYIHHNVKALKIVEYPKGADGKVIEGAFELGHTFEGETAAAMYEDIFMNKYDNITTGANLKTNEYGPQVYADLFFFITGFHGFHVFSGVIINFIILLMAIKGVFARRGHYEMVEKVGLYWHFVDLVWVFVFTFFYLI